MPVTEVMIISFDGRKPVSTICLEGGMATVTLTEVDEDGESVVQAAWERSTSVFADVRDVVKELSVVPSQ